MSQVFDRKGHYYEEVGIIPIQGGLGSSAYPIYTAITGSGITISGVTIDVSPVTESLAYMMDSSGIKKIVDTVDVNLTASDIILGVSGNLTASTDNSDVIAALSSGVIVTSGLISVDNFPAIQNVSGNINSIVGVVQTSGGIYRENIITARANSLLTDTYVSGVAIDLSNSRSANIYVNYSKGTESSMYLKIECGDSLAEIYQESTLVASISGVYTAYPVEYKFDTTNTYRLEYEPIDKYMVISVRGAGTVTGSGLVKVKVSN